MAETRSDIPDSTGIETAAKSAHSSPRPFPRLTLRRAAIIAFAGGALTVACLFADQHVAEFSSRLQDGGDLRIGGDVRRTLLFLQQFGDLASSVIVAIVILLLDRSMRTRMLHWIAGAVATAATTQALKMLVGRPRPRVVLDMAAHPDHATAWSFTGPLGRYPLPRSIEKGGDEAGYLWAAPWEVWKDISSDLHSMPSSHTSAAAALGIALAIMYPRLTWLMVGLVAIVAAARVIFGAHYPSDVAAGATVGLLVTWAVMQWLGERENRAALSENC